jgi:hypothetical protein
LEEGISMPVDIEEWDLHKDNWTHWVNSWRYACGGANISFPDQLHLVFDPPIPEDDVRRWLDWHQGNPIPADVGNNIEIGRVPPKRELIDKADATHTWLAFSEIIDNILDNYRRKSSELIEGGIPPENLIVSVDVMQPQTNQSIFIYIDENSGGIPSDALDAFVSLGVSGWDSDQDTVGCWGNGQKIAMAKLGRHNEVTTSNGVENEFVIRLGASTPADADGGGLSDSRKHYRNYYHPDNTYWPIQTYPLHENSPTVQVGKTISCFKKVPETTFNDLTTLGGWQLIVKQLTQIFANKFHEIPKLIVKQMALHEIEADAPTISINLGHDDHETVNIVNSQIANIYGEYDELKGDFDELEKTFSLMPGIKPRRMRITIPENQVGTGLSQHDEDDEYNANENIGYNPANIELEILVGIRDSIPERSGITFWGNGKLFEKSWDKFIPLTGLPHGRNTDDIQQRFWKCYVRIWSENPILVPWGLGTKWTHRDESPAKIILNVIYHAVCYPYWKASMDGQWVGGQSRIVRELVSGLWRDDLPDSEEKRICPTTQEELKVILNWMYDMDDDMVIAYLGNYFPLNERVETITFTPEIEEGEPEPVPGPIPIEGFSEQRNTLFRNKVTMRTLETNAMYRPGGLFRNAPNQPAGEFAGINARDEDLCAKYMIIRTWPEAFLSTEIENRDNIDINSFNTLFDAWLRSQVPENDDNGDDDNGDDDNGDDDNGDVENLLETCKSCGQLIIE